jgi:hypothetical protein
MVTASPKGRRSHARESSSDDGQRLSVSALYETAEGTLFVPSENMLVVHERSAPGAVLERAGHSANAWHKWRAQYSIARPWLFDWLYHFADAPPGENFAPTEAMLAFRQQSGVRAIARGSARVTAWVTAPWSRPPGDNVSHSVVCSWLRRYETLPWFRRWLLMGEAPPQGITVATARQIRRCRKAWDYVAHCSRAGISAQTYLAWFRRGQIPDVAWVRWLYGAPPPATAFIINAALQRLRRQMACTGARDIADVDSACARRAGVAVLDVTRAAQRVGVERELQQYLRGEDPYHHRRGGLLAPNFFVPTADMLAFRTVVAETMAQEAVWRLKELPGFDAWFLDWTMPRGKLGQRLTVLQTNPTSNGPGPEARDKPAPGQRGISVQASTILQTTPLQPASGSKGTDDGQGTVRQHKRPAHEKHQQWKTWKEEGLSYNQIVQRHLDETGEEVSRDAIIQALRRL